MATVNPYITQIDPDATMIFNLADIGYLAKGGASPAEAAGPIFERCMDHALHLWQKGHYAEARLELLSAVAFAKETGLPKGRLEWAKGKLYNLLLYIGGFDWVTEEARRAKPV